jgi:hypothetical protein
MYRLATLFLFLTCVASAEDDAVRFKPKAYTPGKTVQDRTYRAPAYTPATQTPATGARATPARSGFWGLFKPKPLQTAPRYAAPPVAQNTPYVQRQKISVPSITPDTGAMAEHTPFISSDKKLEDAGFQAPEKSREKNPLLAPRQGIKEPE